MSISTTTLFRRSLILFRGLFFFTRQRCVMLSSGLTNQSTSQCLYRKASESLFCSYLGAVKLKIAGEIAEICVFSRHSIQLICKLILRQPLSIPAQKGFLPCKAIPRSAFFALFCRLLNAANGLQIFLLHGRKILRLIFPVFRLCLLHRLRVADGSPVGEQGLSGGGPTQFEQVDET